MKKLISLILIACMLVSAGVIGVGAATASDGLVVSDGTGMAGNTLYGLLGDANEDGVITIKDATAIQKYIAVLALLGDIGTVLADVDMNVDVNIKDATNIQKHIADIAVSVPIGKTLYAKPSYQLHHHSLDDIVICEATCAQPGYIMEFCACGAGTTQVLQPTGEHTYDGYFCEGCDKFDATQTYDYLVDFVMENYDDYYDGGIYSVTIEWYDYEDGGYDKFELMYYGDRDSLVFFYDGENYTDYTYDRVMLIVPRTEDVSAVSISGCDVYFESNYLDYEYMGVIENASFDGDVEDITFLDGGYSNFFTEESIKTFGANVLDDILFEISWYLENYTYADINDLGFANY